MLNRAQVIGNIGQDPKVSQGAQSKVVSFSVATTEKGYTTRDGAQVPDRTEWHNIVCFGRWADVAAQYLKKGSKVYVEGKMRTRQYEDRLGVKRYITEINVEQMEMLDPKPQTQQTQQATSAPQYANQAQPTPQPQQGGGDGEDLPF